MDILIDGLGDSLSFSVNAISTVSKMRFIDMTESADSEKSRDVVSLLSYLTARTFNGTGASAEQQGS